jgi:predicted DCC family thiol-disulfide oxidoreductase YuxK
MGPVVATEPRATVVFDGGCQYCRRQERRIRRLDWTHAFESMPYDTAVEHWPEVARGTLGDGLRVRFPDGSVTIGIDAVRSIAIRLPLMALPALLLWIPPLRALGAVAYRFVAARRLRDADDGASCPT